MAGTGKLAVIRGTYADPSMTVYALAAPDGSVENLKVAGDLLVPLDGQMLPLPGSLGGEQQQASSENGVLRKISEDAAGDAPGP